MAATETALAVLSLGPALAGGSSHQAAQLGAFIRLVFTPGRASLGLVAARVTRVCATGAAGCVVPFVAEPLKIAVKVVGILSPSTGSPDNLAGLHFTSAEAA